MFDFIRRFFSTSLLENNRPVQTELFNEKYRTAYRKAWIDNIRDYSPKIIAHIRPIFQSNKMRHQTQDSSTITHSH